MWDIVQSQWEFLQTSPGWSWRNSNSCPRDPWRGGVQAVCGHICFEDSRILEILEENTTWQTMCGHMYCGIKLFLPHNSCLKKWDYLRFNYQVCVNDSGWHMPEHQLVWLIADVTCRFGSYGIRLGLSFSIHPLHFFAVCEFLVRHSQMANAWSIFINLFARLPVLVVTTGRHHVAGGWIAAARRRHDPGRKGLASDSETEPKQAETMAHWTDVVKVALSSKCAAPLHTLSS